MYLARIISMENNQNASEIENNINKAKKILFLKEQEIKTQKDDSLKFFISELLPSHANNDKIKEELFSFIEGNQINFKKTKVPDYLCCKITFVIFFFF